MFLLYYFIYLREVNSNLIAKLSFNCLPLWKHIKKIRPEVCTLGGYKIRLAHYTEENIASHVWNTINDIGTVSVDTRKVKAVQSFLIFRQFESIDLDFIIPMYFFFDCDGIGHFTVEDCQVFSFAFLPNASFTG